MRGSFGWGAALLLAACSGPSAAGTDAGAVAADGSQAARDAAGVGADAGGLATDAAAEVPDAGDQGSGDTGPLPAELVKLGDPVRVLLQGLVVTPSQAFAGEVLVENDLITCVAASCSGEAGAALASVVKTHGLIFPGLINTNDHALFGAFDQADWSPTASYTNHEQWPNDLHCQAMIGAEQYLSGQGASPIDLSCELEKYGELKQLVAGTTSIVSAAAGPSLSCYRTLARTIDLNANGLCGTTPPKICPDAIQVSSALPSGSVAAGVCANFASGATNAFLVQAGEGTDQAARDELTTLQTVTTTHGCLLDARTTIVHGTAFTATEFATMGSHGMGLSWSPRSDVTLYGGGTDLSKTADVPLAIANGIKVSLGTTWSVTGSANLLDELRFADSVDAAQWGDALTPQALVEMVTVNAANQLGVGAQIGSLEVGKKADLMVIGGDSAAPYQALLGARPADVRLVMVDGKTLYGDGQLEGLGPTTPNCEPLDVCGRAKFLCTSVSGGTAADKFSQSLENIETALNDALLAYDAKKLSAFSFSPIAPLVDCP